MNNGRKSLAEVHESVEVPVKKSSFKTLLAYIGPAYLVSVGYMDPGNWATDIAGGSAFGYRLIWVLLMSNLMALLLQSLSARLGIVRGLDLAQASRHTYPAWVNYSLYGLAEIAIAATDLAEIIGMAIGLHLLFGFPLLWGVLITVLDSFILLFLINKGIRVMEAFIISLVSIIGFSFLLEMMIVQPQMSDVVKGFVPTGLDGSALYIAIGIIGATVMPHNLYLHSSLVQSRKIERTHEGIKRALKYNFIDSTIALNLAFFVNAAILVLAATAFFKNGYNDVAEIQDAHLLLSNIFGSMAPALFAIALIAAGQSSTITGTLAGQIVMEGYLDLRIRPWIRRILTRAIAIVPAVFTIIYFGENELGELLVLSQVVLSLQLGFAIIPLIHFVSDKVQMKEFVISNKVKFSAWLIAVIIVSLNIHLVIDETSVIFHSDISVLWKLLLAGCMLFVALLLVYVVLFPLMKKYTHDITLPHGFAVDISSIEHKSYNCIGIALDFSGTDRQMIEQATSLGGKSVRYVLIHIVETAGARLLGKDIQDKETQEDERILGSYAEQMTKMGFETIAVLEFGSPVVKITEQVKKSDCDLLIMGSHGHKGIKDIIFGSTADEVRHKVSIPVMIVKAETHD
ncbi:MAG TPA: Nramp family divalent metal transporter [Bacteroidia bacterium]|nr:Nramp family divalent metal transporter [Bacteroidia bacterium]